MLVKVLRRHWLQSQAKENKPCWVFLYFYTRVDTVISHNGMNTVFCIVFCIASNSSSLKTRDTFTAPARLFYCFHNPFTSDLDYKTWNVPLWSFQTCIQYTHTGGVTDSGQCADFFVSHFSLCVPFTRHVWVVLWFSTNRQARDATWEWCPSFIGSKFTKSHKHTVQKLSKKHFSCHAIGEVLLCTWWWAASQMHASLFLPSTNL